MFKNNGPGGCCCDQCPDATGDEGSYSDAFDTQDAGWTLSENLPPPPGGYSSFDGKWNSHYGTGIAQAQPDRHYIGRRMKGFPGPVGITAHSQITLSDPNAIQPDHGVLFEMRMQIGDFFDVEVSASSVDWVGDLRNQYRLAWSGHFSTGLQTIDQTPTVGDVMRLEITPLNPTTWKFALLVNTIEIASTIQSLVITTGDCCQVSCTLFSRWQKEFGATQPVLPNLIFAKYDDFSWAISN